jgi:hypothetical protein
MKKQRVTSIDPVHHWFELSYANYVALPRTVLQSMPDELQQQFVDFMDKLDEFCDWRRDGQFITYRDQDGKFITDELNDYQRGRRILSPEQIAEITRRHNESR